MINLRNYFFLVFLWLGFLPVGFAQSGWPPVFEIKADSALRTLDTTHFQLLEDRKGTYTFDQVRHNPSFYVDSYSNPNRHSHVYWIRMRIKNETPRELNLFLCDFSSSYMDVYWLDAKQTWQHQRTGELIPNSQLPDQDQGAC